MNKDRSTGLRYPQAGLWEGDRSVRLWGILWGVPAFGLCLGNETDYFQPDWQSAFWGSNYARLLQVKRRYDPHGPVHGPPRCRQRRLERRQFHALSLVAGYSFSTARF